VLATSPVRYVFENLLQRSKAKTDYEYNQRKRLRSKIGGYHGRLLETATSLNYRLLKIYEKRDEPWLQADGDYTKRWPDGYFFNSTIYRFMAFVAVANRFEREALYVDSRIGTKTDRLFVYYIKALRWTLTDVALFDGLDYDDSMPTDHFYTDHLRRMCAAVWKKNGKGLLDLRAIEDYLAEPQHELDGVLRFFDGLQPDEPGRYRWDRVMAFQLVLVAFIHNFGYEIDESDPKWFAAAAGRMRPEVATNLLAWLPKHGIGKRSGLGRHRDAGGRHALEALRPHELPDHVNRLKIQAGVPSGTDPQA
jgi:hypothetical protein